MNPLARNGQNIGIGVFPIGDNPMHLPLAGYIF